MVRWNSFAVLALVACVVRLCLLKKERAVSHERTILLMAQAGYAESTSDTKETGFPDAYIESERSVERRESQAITTLSSSMNYQVERTNGREQEDSGTGQEYGAQRTGSIELQEELHEELHVLDEEGSNMTQAMGPTTVHATNETIAIDIPEEEQDAAVLLSGRGSVRTIGSLDRGEHVDEDLDDDLDDDLDEEDGANETKAFKTVKNEHENTLLLMNRNYTTTNDTFVRPPLETLVTENNTIIGDVSWLINFATIGFGKCGTSTLMHWLAGHPEIQSFRKEITLLMGWQVGKMARLFYTNLPEGPYQRGYKAPQDIAELHVLNFFREYWPEAKLIVGVRHPVKWFESLYNFRVQNARSITMPHPNKLKGACTKGKYHTCTNKGDFAKALMNLGKSNFPEPQPATQLETQILSRYRRGKYNVSAVPYIPNPVFLFELDQLGDDNETRNRQLRKDVQEFMGLKEELPPLPHKTPGRKVSSELQALKDSQKIDICDEEYEELREHLMTMSRRNSWWIRKTFLLSPDVFISNPDHFEEIMQGWMLDPCTNETIVDKDPSLLEVR